MMRPNQKKARPMCRKEQKDSEEPAELEPVPAEDDDCIMLVDDDEPEPHELLQEEPALQEGLSDAIGCACVMCMNLVVSYCGRVVRYRPDGSDWSRRFVGGC